MKQIIKKIMLIITKLQISLCKIINKRYSYTYLKTVCEASETYLKQYLSYNVRPIEENSHVYANIDISQHPKTAIILQGPINEKDNFTIETLKIYKKTMSDSVFIVSTWNDTDSKIIKKIEELGVKVILSEKPKWTGIGNINFQIVSTIAGLKYAKENNIEYVMKTRTDQRYEKNNLLEFMFSLEQQFPIGDNFKYLNQQKRIIVTQGSSEGIMFIPYFISDFFYFGKLEDIMNLFDYELQKINQTAKERSKRIKDENKKTVFEYYESRAPEIMIIENYISKKGQVDIRKNLEYYWKFVKDNLITLSNSEVQFFWNKYEKHYLENNINYNFIIDDNQRKYATYTWNFSNWFSLYAGNIKYNKEYEKIQQQLIDIYRGEKVNEDMYYS